MKKNKKGYKKKKRLLDEVDYFLIAKLLDNPSLTDKELSLALDEKLKPLAINTRRNNDLFQDALKEPTREARGIMNKAKLRAATKLRRHVEDTDPKVSIRACENILKNEIEQPPVININLGDYKRAWDDILKKDKEEDENK